MRIFIRKAPLFVRAALLCLVIFSARTGYSLPLEEVLHRLKDSSPQLAQSRQELALIHAEYTASRTWPNPHLVGGQTFLGADEEPVESSIGVEQELGFLWSQRSKVNATRFAFEATQAHFEEERNRLAAEVMIAAYDFDGCRQLKRELELTLTQARRLMLAVDARCELGDISRYDSERFAFEILHLEKELVNIESAEQAALTKLVALTGLSGNELTDLELGTTDFSEKAIIEDLDALLMDGKAQRALLRSVELEKQSFKSELSAKKSGMIPGLAFAVGQNRAESGDTGLYWEAGLEIPLFGQGRSEINASRVKLRTVELTYTAAERQVEQEIRGAYDSYTRIQDVITTPVDSLMQRARENIERGSLLYIEGELSVFELVDVLSSGYEANASAIALRNSAVTARIELWRAMGVNLLETQND